MFYRSPAVHGVVVLGREPHGDHRPSELKEIGQLGLAQLRGWTGSLAKDTQDEARGAVDPFSGLAARWRWNLYVTDAESVELTITDGESEGQFRAELLRLGQELYQKHVKEAFPTPQLPPTSVERRGGAGRRQTEWVGREIESLSVTS
jgi:hypothetical protein